MNQDHSTSIVTGAIAFITIAAIMHIAFQDVPLYIISFFAWAFTDIFFGFSISKIISSSSKTLKRLFRKNGKGKKGSSKILSLWGKGVSKKYALWVWKACGGGRGAVPRVSDATTPYHHAPEPPSQTDQPTKPKTRTRHQVTPLLLLAGVLLSSCSTYRWHKTDKDTHFESFHVENLTDSTWSRSMQQQSGSYTTIQYQAVVLPDGSWAPDTASRAVVTVIKYDNTHSHESTTGTQSHTERTDSIQAHTTTTTETKAQHTTSLRDDLKGVIWYLWLLFALVLLLAMIWRRFRR